MNWVIFLHAPVNGARTRHDHRYVVDYDPSPVGEGGSIVRESLVTSADIAKAKRFENAIEALTYSRRSNGMRPDGRPNRPMTAYTIEIKREDL